MLRPPPHRCPPDSDNKADKPAPPQDAMHDDRLPAAGGDMREFGVHTIDGHRIMFGQEL